MINQTNIGGLTCLRLILEEFVAEAAVELGDGMFLVDVFRTTAAQMRAGVDELTNVVKDSPDLTLIPRLCA